MKPSLPADVRSIERAAISYLQRYFTARGHLRELLLQKTMDPAAAAPIVDEVLDRLEAMGALDDASYARAKVRGLVNRGASPMAIRSRLQAKGIKATDVRTALDEVAEENGEDPKLSSARAYARKRRLGCFRNTAPDAPPPSRAEMQADLAKMARAGFAYDIAKRVLAKAQDEE